ncbi:MAG: cytochrome c biogenesis CcdA family protein [Proteobacteria bacterium]|nr:cytochrome c biogenesis CcdA family protein [Pseudomonadota bacterium]
MAAALNPALGFAAGALTILSPCVLPLVPVVLTSAAQRHRLGPLALAGGLVVAFTAVGFLVAAFGSLIGLDSLFVRKIGAVVLCAAGGVLLVDRLQDWLSGAAAPLAAWAGERQARVDGHGLAGQAAVGALLGVVWSPCVGPTLGAATVLAAEGKNLAEVAVVMLAFGLGIAAVLLALAFTARSVLARWRTNLMSTGKSGKRVLGVLLLVIGVAILTGTDRRLEAAILDRLPDRVIDWSTAF